MIKISVIIPCYNQENYIAQCLDSVLTQTFQDYEIIVINDGSTDKSLDIIQTYVDKYTQIKLINQSNQGVIAARNNGISQAQGAYIYPLDGDDKIAPTCLEKLYHAMQENKGDVIYSDNEYFGCKTGKIRYLKPTKLNMALGNYVCVSALYRKSDWEKYGGYDAMMKAGFEDWEFWLNFVEDNKVFYKVEETLFYYRINTDSRNHTISKLVRKNLVKLIREKHTRLYNYKLKGQILLRKILRFFYQRKVTQAGYVYIKVCKIPFPKMKLKEEL